MAKMNVQILVVWTVEKCVEYTEDHFQRVQWHLDH